MVKIRRIVRTDKSVSLEFFDNCFELVLNVSFVYAYNLAVQRKSLWRDLSDYKRRMGDRPWCILGDFSSALNPGERDVDEADDPRPLLEFRIYRS